MQQVFAQLAVDIRNGAQWWLTAEEEAQLEAQNRHFQSVSVIEEKIRERARPDGNFGKYMTAMQLLVELDYKHPTNAQCKEAAAVLRSIYGEPRRVQGRTRWKVFLIADAQVWQTQLDEDEY